MGKGKFFVFIFAIVLTLGFFLRFFRLTSFPVGFNIDEASKGYSAYSILQTGKDDNGNFFPLYIDIFGDNSPSGYHLLTTISVSILGLTEFAVRLPGALFGSLTIFSLFFLAFSIFENKKISLLSSFLLAISPWHINLSRMSSEGIISLFLIISGFALIIWSLKKQEIKHLLWGIILLSISFFFYQTPRLFIPLLLTAAIVFYYFILKIKISSYFKKILIVSYIGILLLDFILIFVITGGTGRFSQVNIFGHPETKLVLEEQIREDGISQINPLFARFYHNKLINYSLKYISNYFEYFSFDFLFIEKLPDWAPIPNMGVLYLIEMPFILLGISLITFNKNKSYLIVLIWLAISPMIAALTVDLYNIQRASVMYPILEIVAAYGMIVFFGKIKKFKKTILGIFILLFLFNFSYFLHQYFVHTKTHRTWTRGNGFPKMIEVVKQNYDNYDKIVTTKSGGGYPLFQFYLKYDPKTYQSEGSPKDKSYSGFGKLFFSPDNCPFSSKDPLIPKKGKIIFIEDGLCKENKNLKNYKYIYIYREDATKAFRMVFFDK